MIDHSTGEGICVIDLDTSMLGLVLYDFGDIVRTGISLAARDEKDLDRVCVEIQMFKNIVCGYLDTAGSFLTQPERAHLAFSCKLMSL